MVLIREEDREASIVMTIEEEERRLAARLAGQKAEAERIVSAARAEAAARVAAFRERLPRLIEEWRSEELVRIEREVARTVAEASQECERLRGSIAERIELAIDLAVRAAWPEIRYG